MIDRIAGTRREHAPGVLLWIVVATFLLLVPAAGAAQSRATVPRVAFITTTSPDSSPSAEAFKQRLRELGYIEGQSILIEWRWGYGKTDRFRDFADEVARMPVDVIVAGNAPAGTAARAATSSIPIVIATMVDPVADGLVASLGRPGGNITGFTLTTPDTIAKRLQLLAEAIPSVSRIGLLIDANTTGYGRRRQVVEMTARTLGVQLDVFPVGAPADIGRTFASMHGRGVEAVLVNSDTMLYANRAHVAEQALKARLPTICGEREHAEAGCLISYGARISDVFRGAANLVDRILKGAKPAELPVEEPTTFELILNQRNAKALGVTFPTTLRIRADRILE